MTPYLDYLRNRILPQDKKEAKSLMYQVANYTLIDDVLYKRRFSFPYLRCFDLMKASGYLRNYMLESVVIIFKLNLYT